MLSKGQKINDRYEIIKSIGEGGMANVYLAHDSILDRKVAIKVLRGDLENNEKFIRRFQREAKSVSDLSHPNIVEVYDVGEEEGQHYIVMEYIDGRTLKQLIQKRGALTVAEVLDIMTQLTDGLAAAHEAYIIHRDIKPQNIMILDNGMVKITDFGIAMTLNATQLTQTNSVMGSVHYLPPEQASGQTATTKSDIYSSGILMYELLTGSVPFKGDNAVEIALKQMKERIPSIRKQNPLIPQSVENIVLKATAKNPKNRYDSIKDMHDDLVHALDPDRQNETRYKYPYPESEMDESKEIPIKEPEEEIYQPKSEIEKPKSNENTSNKENKKLNIIILVALILFLILIGAIFYYNHRNNNATVIVPNVSKLKTSQAKKKLKEKGFKFSVEEKEDDKIKKGYVIKTNPDAGSSKKKGSIITIIESSGPKKLALEDYTGEDATSVKKELQAKGIKVTITKKSVDNPANYVGKYNQIIAQHPEFLEDDDQKLKKGDKVTLYIPDIYKNYPNMKDEGWTLAKAQEFATSYGLTLNVKDSSGKTINDYSQYLDKTISNQDRTGQIASGVSFGVTIDVDTTTYNLTINYYIKGTKQSISDSKTESHKNGDSGNISCPGKGGYITDTDSVSYAINGSDTTVNCYYIEEQKQNTSTTD